MTADWIQGFAAGIFACLVIAAIIGGGLVYRSVLRDRHTDQ